jgi:hypothetical protein
MTQHLEPERAAEARRLQEYIVSALRAVKAEDTRVNER